MAMVTTDSGHAYIMRQPFAKRWPFFAASTVLELIDLTKFASIAFSMNGYASFRFFQILL